MDAEVAMRRPANKCTYHDYQTSAFVARQIGKRRTGSGMMKSEWDHSGPSSGRVSLTPPFMVVLERLKKLNPFKKSLQKF
jgi:hypothetical protein